MTKPSELSADQCYYGYTNHGHGLLCASFANKDLLAFLSRVTDLPINKPADVYSGIFYGCHRFEHYLVFTKTFPDEQSIRPGMVFTHAIIIETTLSEKISALEEIFNLFVSNIPVAKPTTLPRVVLPTKNDQKTLTISEEQELLPILKFLLAAKADQVLVIPLDQKMPSLYFHLWNGLTPALRRLLAFRLSFNPVDVEPSAYQLYFTPVGLLSRWPQDMQYALYQATTDKVSESVKFLVAAKDTGTFASFIHELGYQIKDFKGIGLCELAFISYKQLNDLDPHKLIQLFRLVLVLSPTKSNGRSVKTIIIEQLIKKLEQPQKETFLLQALANIGLASLENFPTTVGPKIEQNIVNWWKARNLDFLVKVIKRRVEAAAIDWWVAAIDAGFRHITIKITDDDVTLIYKNWEMEETSIAYLWSLLPATSHSEALLVRNLPTNIEDNVFSQLLPLVKKRRWLQFHASMITQKLKPEKALAEQLKLTTDDKVSLMIIAKQFPAAEFIQTAIAQNNPVLQEIALSLPLEIEDLEPIFEVENEQWQEFIKAKLNESIRQKMKLDPFTPIIDLILNGLVEGKNIPIKLLSLISTTTFANIRNYPNRCEVWGRLQGSLKNVFLKATGSALLEDIITTANFEPPLRDAMLALNIVGDYLQAQSRSWHVILRIFETFPSLPETYLADQLRYPNTLDTSADATRLGSLIKKNEWRNSANLVYEKAKVHDSYKIALALCLDLLDFFRKMKVKYTFTNMSYSWTMSETEWLTNFESLCIEMYDEENEIRIIWKKAQGDVADLKSKQSARAIWHDALQDLRKGKMKDITFRKLLLEMLTNFPTKKEQLQMLLSALNEIKSIK